MGKLNLIPVKPERATEIISTSVPPLLAFYRNPIPETTQDDKPKNNPERQYSSAAADLAAASVPTPEPQPVPIFGSVSNADIIESIKALLGETEEGARVVLGLEDVTIVREKEEDSNNEADRLKTLGEFQVDIQVKGGSAVRRAISIRAQES